MGDDSHASEDSGRITSHCGDQSVAAAAAATLSHTEILARLERITAALESLAEEKQCARARRAETGIAGAPYNVAEVARAIKVKPEKVQLWIRRGELAAFNVASAAKGQPQWRITPAALAAFQADRAAKLTAPPVARSNRRARRHRPPIKEILS